MANCPKCGAENLETSRFCSECGSPLKGEYAATATYEAAKEQLSENESSSSDSCVHGRFLPGTKIGGRYRIVSLVGKGGMGEVYRADDLKLGQTVALKFLPKDFSDDPQRLAYFHSEVRLARQVSHPNVCRVYDIGEVDGQHFLSMEYVDGEDLATLIRRIGRLPPGKGVEIARQLCAGLAAAHDKGVLHRDLKPANVMLDGRGRVRITDFGLARLTDEKGGRGVQAGTPAYMAPEQAAGREVTERSDLYSLGLLLYEVFTGKSVTLLRSGSTPPTLSSAVPDLDGSVERVILRCLEWEPAQRPASAWAVAAAFPGSDPLLAALAAGETPSPEMVAAAGGRAGLPARQAVACLVILGIGLLLACLLAEKTYLSNRVELETPTHLREVVRAWLEKHPKRLSSDSADEADGFTLAPDPATAASSIHYWYRRRSAPLLPTENGSFGNVDLASPPLDSPEEISIELDGTGHLVRFVRVPPSRVDPEVNSDATRPPTEWEAWFPEEVTGFHFQDLVNDSTVLKGRSLPSHPYDDIRGWKRKSDDPAQDQYVIVAAFQGHPTHFEIGPWNQPPAQPVRPNFWGWLMLVLLPVVAAVALRNYWSGRVDRQTVTRVAAIIFVLGMFKYILSANHQWGQLELMPLFLALASSAFLAAYFAFWYSGLEPLVRRIWPQTLITWTRAVAGQLRDPLVGRDLLLGTVFGVLHLLIVQLGAAIQNWTGADDVALPMLLAESLLGVQGSLSAMLQLHLWAFQLCVFSFAILVFLRHLLRREMLAIAAFGAVVAMGLIVFPSAQLGSWTWVIPALAMGVAWSLHGFVIVRFGFLAFVVAWTTVNVLLFLPLTTHFTPPQLAGSMVALGFVVSIALLGFDMTLDGRPHRAVLRWVRGG